MSDQDDGPDHASSSHSGNHPLRSFLKEMGIVVVAALIIAALLRAFVGQPFSIPSGSMQNTLGIGDRVIAEKLTGVKRGEVVVFADPGGWLSDPSMKKRGPAGKVLEFFGILPDSSKDYLTKRVIGLPGDTVKCCDRDGHITVNGHALDERSYLYRGPDGHQVEPSEIRFTVTVPSGRVFLLGDHRNNSRDSRCHLNDEGAAKSASHRATGDNAFVPKDLVVGRAIAVYMPLSSMRRLPIPGAFEHVPDPKKKPPPKPAVDAGGDADC